MVSHQDPGHDQPGKSRPVSLAFALPIGIGLLAVVVLVITLALVRPWEDDDDAGGGALDTRSDETQGSDTGGSGGDTEDSEGGTRMIPGAGGTWIIVPAA